MSVQALAQWLSETPLAFELADSNWLFGTVEALHVAALTVVVGSIALVDLRLIGIGPARGSAQQVIERLVPFSLIGFAFALASGSVLLFANPIGYAENFWFAVKFSLLALAGINAVIFHLFAQKKLAEGPSVIPRISGAVSLTLWIGIVIAGRWIGYTL